VVFSLVPPDGGFPDDEIVLMAVWSPTSDTLFYRRGDDVYQWTPDAGAKRVLRGVPWLHPSFTPDGRHVAWARETADGGVDVYVAETTNLSSARRVRRNGRDPVLLNNRQLWYRPEPLHSCAG